MSNNTMISVPREKLEQVLNCWNEVKTSTVQTVIPDYVITLREILAHSTQKLEDETIEMERLQTQLEKLGAENDERTEQNLFMASELAYVAGLAEDLIECTEDEELPENANRIIKKLRFAVKTSATDCERHEVLESLYMQITENNSELIRLQNHNDLLKYKITQKDIDIEFREKMLFKINDGWELKIASVDDPITNVKDRKVIGFHKGDLLIAVIEPIQESPEARTVRWLDTETYDFQQIYLQSRRYQFLMSPAVRGGCLTLNDGWIDFEDKLEAENQIDKYVKS